MLPEVPWRMLWWLAALPEANRFVLVNPPTAGGIENDIASPLVCFHLQFTAALLCGGRA